MISAIADHLRQVVPAVSARIDAVTTELGTRRDDLLAKVQPTYDEFAQRGEALTRSALETIQDLHRRTVDAGLGFFTIEFADMGLDLEDETD